MRLISVIFVTTIILELVILEISCQNNSKLFIKNIFRSYHTKIRILVKNIFNVWISSIKINSYLVSILILLLV